jgi:CBS domain containing-hemolysin-like protein
VDDQKFEVRSMPRNKLYVVKLTLATLAVLLPASPARASIFEGETLDKLANILSWVVLVIAPAVGIVVFWLLHILPEKIAERKHHPQAKAIQTLCLLSLFFGGILWPLAWLWAYTKPVLYKMAYGTDEVAHGEGASDHGAKPKRGVKTEGAAHENERLRQRIAELEARLAAKPANEGGAA